METNMNEFNLRVELFVIEPPQDMYIVSIYCLCMVVYLPFYECNNC